MSSDCLRVENKVMKEIYLYDDDVIGAQLLTRSPLIPMSPLKPGKPSSPWNTTEMRFASNSLVISLYCFWRHFFISHSETFSLHFTGISLSLQTVCIYWTCGSQDVCCPLLAGEWNNIHVCNKLCLAVGINHCMLHLPALYIYHLHQLDFLVTKYINI